MCHKHPSEFGHGTARDPSHDTHGVLASLRFIRALYSSFYCCNDLLHLSSLVSTNQYMSSQVDTLLLINPEKNVPDTKQYKINVQISIPGSSEQVHE